MTKKTAVVLNWYEIPQRFTRGLRKFFQKRAGGSFITLRHGSKWADKLNPGDKVAISISNNPAKPNIIGYAIVQEVRKVILFYLRDEELTSNIGAKTRDDVWVAMNTAYAPKTVGLYDTVSVIKLTALR